MPASRTIAGVVGVLVVAGLGACGSTQGDSGDGQDPGSDAPGTADNAGVDPGTDPGADPGTLAELPQPTCESGVALSESCWVPFATAMMACAGSETPASCVYQRSTGRGAVCFNTGVRVTLVQSDASTLETTVFGPGGFTCMKATLFQTLNFASLTTVAEDGSTLVTSTEDGQVVEIACPDGSTEVHATAEWQQIQACGPTFAFTGLDQALCTPGTCPGGLPPKK